MVATAANRMGNRTSRVILGVVATLAIAEGVARMTASPVALGAAEATFAAIENGDIYLQDAAVGWRMTPSTHLGTAGQDVHTNSLGVRGEEPRSPRVLVIGDSVAAGFGVAQGQAWPWRLGDGLETEVLVAAVPGYSSDQGRRLLGQLLKSYQPKWVIIALGLEDGRAWPVTDGASSPYAGISGVSVLARRLLATAGLGTGPEAVIKVRELARAARLIYPPDDAAEAAVFVDQQAQIRGLLEGAPARVSPERFRENLSAMVAAVRAVNARVILLGPSLARPTMEPNAAESRYAEPVESYREVLQEVGRDAGAAFVSVPPLTEFASGDKVRLFLTRQVSAEEAEGLSLLPVSEREQKGLSPDLRRMTDVRHLSPGGHALVAEAVIPVIQAGGPLE